MSRNHIHLETEQQKQIYERFRYLAERYGRWEVWSDFITMSACSLCLSERQKREQEYTSIVKRYRPEEVQRFVEMFALMVEALEINPNQDFLGDLFMRFDLGNTWKGQFFTPYNICKMMSQMTVGTVDRQIEEQGYISICDPACGAGATLIAAANTLKRSKYNFQNHVLFVGQDVDRVVAQMCYIQLSLLGCAGYICVGNTITNPLTGPVLFPRENEGQEMWYMPMFQSDVWQWRKIFHSLGSMGGTVTTEKTVEKEHFYMFFDFEEKEAQYGNQRI